MLKAAQKKKSTNVKTPVNIKLSPEEKKILLIKAKKYANGNLSLWLRYAGANCTPPAKDLTK